MTSVVAALALGVLLVGLPSVRAESRKSGVVDLHVDLSYQVNFKGQTIARGSGQYVTEWLNEAGVSGVVLPLYVPRNASPTGPQMEHLEGSFTTLSSGLPAARTASGAYAGGLCDARASGTGVQFSFEGAEPLGFELTSVERWARRGVVLFGLVHSTDNALASSSGAGFGPRGYGLSRRGAELLRRAHRLGGVADVSHASDEAFDDIINQASAAGRPVVASHSNARALAPHPRNLTDPQLRAIASTGGVVGVNFHSRFLLGGPGVAEIDDVVRHVLHVARVAGIEHVAIGSDFEGGINPARGLEDIRGFPRLARALERAGMSRAHVDRVFGGNARRVLCAGQAPER